MYGDNANEELEVLIDRVSYPHDNSDNSWRMKFAQGPEVFVNLEIDVSPRTDLLVDWLSSLHQHSIHNQVKLHDLSWVVLKLRLGLD